MAENLGTGVSFVDDSFGYNYDHVVFQKEKPPLDTELNLAQEIQNVLAKRHIKALPSGWLNLKPFYTSPLLESQFYTQDPDNAVPEYAMVNGMVLYVTYTGTSVVNSNIVTLSDPPETGNIVNGVILEVWRALLDTETDDNRPLSSVVIDSLSALDAVTEDYAWSVGENGLILVTENGGATWTIQLIDTKRNLNGVHFINSTVGWVVGDNGTIGRTSSSGASWLILQSGFTENFNGVHAATHLIAWVVGDSGTILKTINGVNWTAQSSNVTVNLNDIYFHDNLVGWAVGDSGTILRTTDGGSNWVALTSGTTENLNAIQFYDLNFGFAVGDNGTILRSSDGGLSWVNQSGNIVDGLSYTSLTVNYTDVTMAPSLDLYINGEEVTSQFSGSNKNCTVMNVPMTKGDGQGTTTNSPADVNGEGNVSTVVKVNDVIVLIDSIDGATGQIILNAAPQACDTVEVYYWYRVSPEIFTGKAWISGASGTALVTDDIGANWVQQTTNTSYDLNGVSFVDQYKGWLAGSLSVIRHTEDSGTTWTEQLSSNVSHRVQRVYSEGNVGSAVFLNDEMVHPDTNIETTKRVQIQYKIRTIENVDPFTYPDAGLGSDVIVALGPNATGSFAYQNMGVSTGDYGLWQAKCSNTVDGYAWAIPMFFVSRRNKVTYNAATNSNGKNVIGGADIRPDLLTETDIVDQDILDVRRQIMIPSVTELLNKNYDLLMNNQLKTRLFRQTTGGDSYATEPLQLDYVGVGSGTEIGTDPTFLSLVAGGGISSSSTLVYYPLSVVALPSTLPDPITRTVPVSRGLFHPNSIYYSARYTSTSSFNGKPIPGKFSGIGTTQVTFTFSSSANTINDDTGLSTYEIDMYYVEYSSTSLTRIPSIPQLVENTGVSGDKPFYYRGVFDTDTSGRSVEEWDSGVSGYNSHAIAYPAIEAGGSAQEARASTVEVHNYIRLTSDHVKETNRIEIDLTVIPDVTDSVVYNIYCIRKINNITSGFSFKIEDIVIGANISITSASGFPFIVGTIIEVIGMVYSTRGDTDKAYFRNGATANFSQSQKGLSPFCYSTVLSLSAITGSTATFTSLNIDTGQTSTSGGIFLGISTTETVDSLTDHFAWVNDVLTPVTVTAFNDDELVITFPTPVSSATVKIQALIQQIALIYQTDGDGLQIAYNFIPNQTPLNLPTSLTTEIITNPTTVQISNLGTGGSDADKEPYDFPLASIPVNNSVIIDDNEFYNLDLFRFADFSIDSGFVQMPAIVPGSFGEELTFSSLAADNLSRSYYSVCSKECVFQTEGIKIAIPRKIFIAMIGRVTEDTVQLLRGEYVLIIMSRDDLLELENYTGYKADSKSAIAIYRLPNKPLVRK